MYNTDCYFRVRNVFPILIKNSLSAAKIVFVVVSGETDLYAEYPGTPSISDQVFCSNCEILDNVIKQNTQLRLLD